MAEVWKKIPKFEYEVSTYGRIKSLPKKHLQKYSTGKIGTHITKEKILNIRHDTKGYSTCILYRGGKTFCKKVHRLVAEAFIKNTFKLPQVNHIDSIKDDNRVENLEWCDNQYNQIHSWASGCRVNNYIGEQNNKAKLKNKDVVRIRLAKMLGMKTRELCEIFNIDRHTVMNIKNMKTWKHIKLLEV